MYVYLETYKMYRSCLYTQNIANYKISQTIPLDNYSCFTIRNYCIKCVQRICLNLSFLYRVFNSPLSFVKWNVKSRNIKFILSLIFFRIQFYNSTLDIFLLIFKYATGRKGFRIMQEKIRIVWFRNLLQPLWFNLHDMKSFMREAFSFWKVIDISFLQFLVVITILLKEMVS